MILRCIAELPTLPQARRLGKHYHPGRQRFPAVIGDHYVAYCLHFWGGGAWVDVAWHGYLVGVPLCLFEVVDGSVPAFWTARIDEDGDLSMRPEAFHETYFHDDLSESMDAAVRAFEAVRAQVEQTLRWDPSDGVLHY